MWGRSAALYTKEGVVGQCMGIPNMTPRAAGSDCTATASGRGVTCAPRNFRNIVRKKRGRDHRNPQLHVPHHT